ncbi:unnamed protein product [Chrysoparadoxa australica]
MSLLHLQHLSLHTMERKLQKILSEFGKIKSISKGWGSASIEFEDANSAELAAVELDQAFLDGSRLVARTALCGEEECLQRRSQHRVSIEGMPAYVDTQDLAKAVAELGMSRVVVHGDVFLREGVKLGVLEFCDPESITSACITALEDAFPSSTIKVHIARESSRSRSRSPCPEQQEPPPSSSSSPTRGRSSSFAGGKQGAGEHVGLGERPKSRSRSQDNSNNSYL